jgi:hypothetical protein
MMHVHRILALAIALLPGCRASVATPPDGRQSQTDGPRTDPRASARAAFVLAYTDRTLVVPLDPKRRVTELPGIWTAHAGTAHGRVPVEIATSDDPALPSLPICPEDEGDAACFVDADLDGIPAWSYVTREGGRRPSWTLSDGDDRECGCVSLEGISSDTPRPSGEPPSYDEVQEAEAAGEELECPEEAPEMGESSMLGGVLYLNGTGHEGTCAGMNIYDGVQEQRGLRRGPDPRLPEMPAPSECIEGDMEFDFERILSGASTCTMGDPSCACEHDAEMEAWVIRRGRLVHAVGNIDTVGAGCTCLATMAVTPEKCPSATDPCGDPRAFEGLADVDEFWVATDGSAALVLDGEFARVLGPHGTKLRDEPGSGVPLGVEFQRNSVLLDVPTVPVRFRAALPRLAATDREFTGSASAWGDRCVAHLRAGRYDEAEAACFAGLRKGGKKSTRGALVYNLGRIAEARKHPATALAWYRRSDRLRPGNAVVRERIAALSAAK